MGRWTESSEYDFINQVQGITGMAGVIEPVLRHLRLGQVLNQLPAGGVHVDIGCGTKPVLLDSIKDKMDFCIGIDSEVTNAVCGNVEYRKCFIKKTLPVETELATSVTMLAVLEHLEYPRAIAKELYRILRPGGVLLLTVPSPYNKPILELLAGLRIVDPEMIRQHQHYYTPQELHQMFTEVGFRTAEARYFQFKLNNLVKAVK